MNRSQSGLQEFCIVINLQGIETTMTLEIQQFRQITSKIQPRGTWKIRSFLRISISTFLKIPGISSLQHKCPTVRNDRNDLSLRFFFQPFFFVPSHGAELLEVNPQRLLVSLINRIELVWWLDLTYISRDSWMYPDPNVPLWEIPYYKPYILGIQSPRIPREHNKYHGYTVRGTLNCPLNIYIYINVIYIIKHLGIDEQPWGRTSPHLDPLSRKQWLKLINESKLKKGLVQYCMCLWFCSNGCFQK